MLANEKRKVGKIIAIIVVVIIVIILLLNPGVQSVLKSIFIDPFQKSYPEYTTFTVERTLTIEANGGTVFNYTLDLPVPEDMSENGNELQELIAISAQPNPAIDDRYSLDWMEWEGYGPVGQSIRTVTITYQMRISTFIWNIGTDEVGNISDIPSSLKSAYLDDEWRIIVNHPDILQRSEAIVGDRTNVKDALSAIYDWITGNIDYSYSSPTLPQTSVETLSSGRGDCDEQAILFCALARAAGIPAWLQLGVLYDPFLEAWGGHGWVQTHLPLGGGEGVNITIDTVNSDFLVWRPNRFADFTDDGNASHLNDYYFSFYCSYDPTSYSEGETPSFGQEFQAVEYQESENRVQMDDFAMSLDISRLLILPGTFQVPARR
jgi:hypothetical protein